MYNIDSTFDLKWAHAVNSAEALTEHIAAEGQRTVHFLEADICCSSVDPSRIIMAHDPVQHGLSFGHWMNTLVDRNKCTQVSHVKNAR